MTSQRPRQGPPPPGLEEFQLRMSLALCALLITPIIGIPAGIFFLWSLERGLLYFNMLGMGLFVVLTYPYWIGRRQRKRRLQLLFSGGSILLSTLSSVFLSHVTAAYAFYFAAMCEAFSLIPWITGLAQEVGRGEWQDPRTERYNAPAQPVLQSRHAFPPYQEEPEPFDGPELPLPAPPWKLLLPVVLAGVLAGGVWLCREAGPEIMAQIADAAQFPSQERVAELLEDRYGEEFQVQGLYYEAEGLRTWQVCPADDPSLLFTVATGPAALEEGSSQSALGEDNYLAHAWNARVVPVLQSYGMTEVFLSITEADLELGTNSGLLLPEPYASDFPNVFTGSVMIGWYQLPVSYWALEEENWPEDAKQISALLGDLRKIRPFYYLGCYKSDIDTSMQVWSWKDWLLPVAVNEGFIAFPIDQSYTPRQILAALESANPFQYYYIEDGYICRPDTFAPAEPVPLP